MTDDRRKFDDFERIFLRNADYACYQENGTNRTGTGEPCQVGHQRDGIERPYDEDDTPHDADPSCIGDNRFCRMFSVIDSPGVEHADDASKRDVQNTDPDRNDHEFGYLRAVTCRRGSSDVEVPGVEQ